MCVKKFSLSDKTVVLSVDSVRPVRTRGEQPERQNECSVKESMPTPPRVIRTDLPLVESDGNEGEIASWVSRWKVGVNSMIVDGEKKPVDPSQY
jgi:hypothetical protein